MIKQIFLAHKTTFRVCDSEIDGEGNNVCVVQGDLSDVDVISHNGYRYKNGFWEKVLAADYVREMIMNRECIGTIEHPTSDEDYLKTPYEKASHVVLSVVVNDGIPNGKFALTNNKMGNTIKSLVDLNVPIGVSTRGLGDILSDDVSRFVNPDNYALITWDFTNKPNFPMKMNAISDSLRSNPLFKELVDIRQLKDSANYNGSLDLDSTKIVTELRRSIKAASEALRTIEGLIKQ